MQKRRWELAPCKRRMGERRGGKLLVLILVGIIEERKERVEPLVWLFFRLKEEWKERRGRGSFFLFIFFQRREAYRELGSKKKGVLFSLAKRGHSFYFFFFPLLSWVHLNVAIFLLPWFKGEKGVWISCMDDPYL